MRERACQSSGLSQNEVNKLTRLTDAPILTTEHPARYAVALDRLAAVLSDNGVVGRARLPIALRQLAVERLDLLDPELKVAGLLDLVVGSLGRLSLSEVGRAWSGSAREGDLRLLLAELTNDGGI